MTEPVADVALLRERVELETMRLFVGQLRGAMLALGAFIFGVVLAWQDFAPLRTRLAWASLTGLACLAQWVIGWRLERARDLAAALTRWRPWLYASILASSSAWGLVPAMVSQGGPSDLPLLLACAFNVTLVFGGSHTPGTPALLLRMALPVSLVSTLTLALTPGHLPHAAGSALLFALVSLYGWRMQVALRDLLASRHVAENLADALRAQQQLTQAAERERTLLLERQRLMHDMHDGVGSHLIALLRMAESGTASPAAMADLLRGAIEELRLTIDSLEPLEHDLATLLATLRNRVGRRLEGAGLALEWQMADMPPLPWLEPAQALQVLRLVQEAITNVVKHARARTLRVSAGPVGDALEVCIADDGGGFDPATAGAGQGLPGMRKRALALGAELHVDAAPGAGCRVRLRLPSAR
ncbi:MAG TPA: sensor histidine kinase [Roseateles sp.]